MGTRILSCLPPRGETHALLNCHFRSRYIRICCSLPWVCKGKVQLSAAFSNLCLSLTIPGPIPGPTCMYVCVCVCMYLCTVQSISIWTVAHFWVVLALYSSILRFKWNNEYNKCILPALIIGDLYPYQINYVGIVHIFKHRLSILGTKINWPIGCWPADCFFIIS